MFAEANNDKKFIFIGGIATKNILLVITGLFLDITVQEITIVG